MLSPNDPVSKLRWRCRRGMRELDALMLGWLDNYYEQADDELRQRFLEMLDMQDPALMDLFREFLQAPIEEPGDERGAHKNGVLKNGVLDIKATDARYDEIVTQIYKVQSSH